MVKTIDLHIHSSYSEDGDYSVNQIFSLAEKADLSGISITDHDSVESVNDALSEKRAIEYIPGVELSTVFVPDGSQQHILGYFIDHTDRTFLDLLTYIQKCRFSVAEKRIVALREAGFTLNDERIWEMAAGRAPTATSIMLEVFDNESNRHDRRLHEYFHGHKKDNRLRYFYREYFTENGPAYVPFESIETGEGIQAIKNAGGIPVLAHPKFVTDRKWLDVIAGYGIQGIEAISSYHDDDENRFYLTYAHEKQLLVTVGSDYHGPTSKPLVSIGGITGNGYEYFSALVKADQNNKKTRP